MFCDYPIQLINVSLIDYGVFSVQLYKMAKKFKLETQDTGDAMQDFMAKLIEINTIKERNDREASTEMEKRQSLQRQFDSTESFIKSLRVHIFTIVEAVVPILEHGAVLLLIQLVEEDDGELLISHSLLSAITELELFITGKINGRRSGSGR